MKSPRRDETFVTRKITRGSVRICASIQNAAYLGDLDAKRDWGFDPDYAEGVAVFNVFINLWFVSAYSWRGTA